MCQIQWLIAPHAREVSMNSRADYAHALLRRAADDFYVVERLGEDIHAPAWLSGFHAQQAVEKSLKAVLSFNAVEFPRTHNLAMLLELALRASLPAPPDGDSLNRLIPFGVALRYEDATGYDDL